MKEILKFLELAKENNEEAFQILLDSIDEMVFYTDLQGKIYYANISYAKYLGRTLEEVIGKFEREILPEEVAEQCQKNSLQAYEHGIFYKKEKSNGRRYETFKSRVKFKNSDIKIFSMIKEI